jgi:hypothetical protein
MFFFTAQKNLTIRSVVLPIREQPIHHMPVPGAPLMTRDVEPVRALRAALWTATGD